MPNIAKTIVAYIIRLYSPLGNGHWKVPPKEKRKRKLSVDWLHSSLWKEAKSMENLYAFQVLRAKNVNITNNTRYFKQKEMTRQISLWNVSVIGIVMTTVYGGWHAQLTFTNVDRSSDNEKTVRHE